MPGVPVEPVASELVEAAPELPAESSSLPLEPPQATSNTRGNTLRIGATVAAVTEPAEIAAGSWSNAAMRRGVIAAWAAAFVWAAPGIAEAHSGGAQGGSCSGCHGNGDHSASLSTMPGNVQPGSTVSVSVSVQGSGTVAGVFVGVEGGSISPIPGQGMASVGDGLTHTSPRNISGGQATFTFEWDVPNGAGATRFGVTSVVANGNGSSSGDGGAEHYLDVVYGCEAQEFFRDFDGDGHGRATLPRLFCAGDAPEGYAPFGDDCDDNRDTTYPGATEFCNLRDDDCDGEIDNDAIPLEQYPDADGDGFYSPAERESGETFVGCVPTDGWAAEPGDCAENDETRNPGVEEICNLLDDNCDGRVDERVRPTCGEGWCRRESSTCDVAACIPGEPIEETCNLLDDDCDGLVDEEAPCDPGLACIAGECREPDEIPDGGSGESSASGGDDGAESDSAGSSSGLADTDTGASARGEGGGCRVGDAPSWLLLCLFGVFAVRRRPR